MSEAIPVPRDIISGPLGVGATAFGLWLRLRAMLDTDEPMRCLPEPTFGQLLALRREWDVERDGDPEEFRMAICELRSRRWIGDHGGAIVVPERIVLDETVTSASLGFYVRLVWLTGMGFEWPTMPIVDDDVRHEFIETYIGAIVAEPSFFDDDVAKLEVAGWVRDER